MQKSNKSEPRVKGVNLRLFGSHTPMCPHVFLRIIRWMERGASNGFCGLILSPSLTSVQVIPQLIAFLLRLTLCSASKGFIYFLLLLQESVNMV